MTKRKYSYSPLNKYKDKIKVYKMQGRSYQEIADRLFYRYGINYTSNGIKSFYLDHVRDS